MIIPHLPILQIILPLLSAPLCLLLRHPRLVWAWATITAISCLPISILLLQQVLVEGPIIYELGGWVAPLGIEYRVDSLNAFILVIVTLVGAIVMFLLGFVPGYGLSFIMKAMGWLRVPDEIQNAGIDSAEFGLKAYQ